MESEIDFNKISEPTWVIESPGILRWEGTGFTIHSDFTGSPIFYVKHNDVVLSFYFTINGAKQMALIISNQMTQMGLDP